MSKYLWMSGAVFFLVWLLRSRASNGGASVPSGPPLPPMTPEQLSEVENLARAGDKITAIKLYRKLTGVGLKEAKDAVEKLAS